MIAFLLAIAFIYIVLAAQFESFCLLITLLITPVVYSMFDDLRGGKLFAWAKLPLTKARDALAWGWGRANGRLASGRRGQ